jgi:excisionase family DNA binding protein
MTENRLMNVRDVAAYLGIDALSVYRWASRGRLPCIRLSARCLRFRREDIEQFVASMSNSPTAENETLDRIIKRNSFYPGVNKSKSKGDSNEN